MKTIDIEVQEQPIEFMRKLYKECLLDDETFHFVNWSNFKWQGRTFRGQFILLRVDNERVETIEQYLKEYYGVKFKIYDYPFPNQKGHLNRFGLGKKSIEAKYQDIFHRIYHLYSIMSLQIEKPKERMEALFQLLHIPLNVYNISFIGEAELYSNLAHQKIMILKEGLDEKEK